MRIPKYRLHKASGLGCVELAGVLIYLGKYGTAEGRSEYNRLIAEFIGRGGIGPPPPTAPAMTVSEAAGRYCDYVRSRRDRREQRHVDAALAHVIRLYGATPISEFGPVRFRAARGQMIAAGWARVTINHAASRVKQMLRWLVGEELYPSEKCSAVYMVPGLRRGEAPDRPPIPPVEWTVVEATLPHMPHAVRGIVQFQRATGCRPGEAVIARREDIDTEGRVTLPGGRTTVVPGLWVYAPSRHKHTHTGRGKWVLIGPLGQARLREYLERPGPGGFLFQPAIQARCPDAGPHYRTDSYAHAVLKAARAAKQPHWHPHQLRHTVATEIKQAFGEETARDILGHSSIDTTSIYAERAIMRAAEAIRTVG